MNVGELIQLLSDCRWHSGQALADRFGVSRATIWQGIQRIETMGLQVYAVRGKGYRMPVAPDWLNGDLIRASTGIPEDSLHIECTREVASTNEDLLNRPDMLIPVVLLAEYQTAGRGRRGKSWQQAFAAGLCLSVGVDSVASSSGAMDLSAGQLALLPFAVGLAVVQELQLLGFTGLGLKWPNDVYFQRRKIGGFLIEHRGEIAGAGRTVIGLGLNLSAGPELDDAASADAACLLDAWTDTADSMPNRSTVAGHVAAGILRAVQSLERITREELLHAWCQHDVLAGQQVRVADGNKVHRGRYAGLDSDGALQLQLPSGQRLGFHAADVSLRGTE